MLASQFFGPPRAPRCNRAVRIRRLVTGVATAHCGARGQPAEGELDMPGYPAQHESEAVLSDGSVIHLRPIRPDDATRLLDLHHRLSPRSLYHRFFTIPRPDPVYAQYLAEVDYINQINQRRMRRRTGDHHDRQESLDRRLPG